MLCYGLMRFGKLLQVSRILVGTLELERIVLIIWSWRGKFFHTQPGSITREEIVVQLCEELKYIISEWQL